MYLHSHNTGGRRFVFRNLVSQKEEIIFSIVDQGRVHGGVNIWINYKESVESGCEKIPEMVLTERERCHENILSANRVSKGEL